MSSVWNTAENLLLAPSMGLPDNRVSSLPEASETVSMAVVFLIFFVEIYYHLTILINRLEVP